MALLSDAATEQERFERNATTHARCSTVSNLPMAVAPRVGHRPGSPNRHDLVTAKMLAREPLEGRPGSHRLREQEIRNIRF
jgi:hypothetical protein